MPLLDHFQAPLSVFHLWTGFHSSWANSITQQLNRDLLPADYYALPNVQLGGQIEIDVATVQREADPVSASGAAVATAVWAPPRPAQSAPVDFVGLDLFEVQVFRDFGGPQLRAAIELISHGNKDRPSARRAFAVKCASYLQRGVSVVMVDVVTSRSGNLHTELLEVLEMASALRWQSPADLYAVAYRTVLASAAQRLEVWPEPLAVGAILPTLPLWLEVDLSLPLRLEESYRATCASLRIRGV